MPSSVHASNPAGKSSPYQLTYKEKWAVRIALIAGAVFLSLGIKLQEGLFANVSMFSGGSCLILSLVVLGIIFRKGCNKSEAPQLSPVFSADPKPAPPEPNFLLASPLPPPLPQPAHNIPGGAPIFQPNPATTLQCSSAKATDLPLYTEVLDRPRKGTGCLATVEWFQSFIQEQPFEPIRAYLECTYTVTSFSIQSLGPAIAVPNRQALVKKAMDYTKKYKIETIKVTTVNELSKKTFTSKGYVAIIVGSEEDIEFGHVLPLLCYFGKNADGSEQVEFMIMDVLGGGDLASDVTEKLKALNPRASIYSTNYMRQADRKSCRTGALILLRNALLSLKYRNWVGSICNPLRQDNHLPGMLINGLTITCLPSEWTYGEQIINNDKHGSNQEAIAIRDLFSKNPQKRAKPRTVGNFRAQHTKPINTEYTIITPSAGKPPPVFPSYESNRSIKVTVSSDSVAFSFVRPKHHNTYLLDKGRREMKMGLEVESKTQEKRDL